MEMQNIQNIPLQPVPPVQQTPVQSDPRYQLCSPVQNNTNYNYIPRYAPLIQQGQFYSVPIPPQGQQAQGSTCGNVGAVNININGVNPPNSGATAPMSQYYPAYLPYFQNSAIPATSATPATPIAPIAPATPIAPIAPATSVVPANPIASATPATQEIKKENTEPKKESLSASTIDKKTETNKTTDKTTEEKKLEESKTENKKTEANKPEDKKTEEKNDKKPTIELTDAYIQQLEKDLNDKDKSVRGHALVELLNKFKEDETKKDDPRLTNLLNLALQDNSQSNVFTAMQIIENGYANGNSVTKKRLQEIKNKRDDFGNSQTAEGILTKMLGRKPETEKTNDASGKKLN